MYMYVYIYIYIYVLSQYKIVYCMTLYYFTAPSGTTGAPSTRGSRSCWSPQRERFPEHPPHPINLRRKDKAHIAEDKAQLANLRQTTFKCLTNN